MYASVGCCGRHRGHIQIASNEGKALKPQAQPCMSPSVPTSLLCCDSVYSTWAACLERQHCISCSRAIAFLQKTARHPTSCPPGRNAHNATASTRVHHEAGRSCHATVAPLTGGRSCISTASCRGSYQPRWRLRVHCGDAVRRQQSVKRSNGVLWRFDVWWCSRCCCW